MKKVLFLLIASFLIIGCEKDNKNNNEEQPKDTPKDLSDINSYVGEWKLTKVIQGHVFENGEGDMQTYNGLPHVDKIIPVKTEIKANEKMITTIYYSDDFVVTSDPIDLKKITLNEEKNNILQQINNTGLVTLNIPDIGNKIYSEDREEAQRESWSISTYVSDKLLIFVTYFGYTEEEINSDLNTENAIFSFTIAHYTH